MKRERLL